MFPARAENVVLRRRSEHLLALQCFRPRVLGQKPLNLEIRINALKTTSNCIGRAPKYCGMALARGAEEEEAASQRQYVLWQGGSLGSGLLVDGLPKGSKYHYGIYL